MADNSVDAIVTDPPYGLSFMGKRWDYDVPSTEVWAECLRVLKPGGHLLAFAGTRTQHRMAVRIEDAGFEIRDMIAWVYGSGFPKSHNGPWGGTALKPALEPITVARKPLIGTVEANWREHGTGALNIDACRVATSESTVRARTESDLGRLNDDGWRPTPGLNGSDNGRWPANLIHDGSEDLLATFPNVPGQQGDLRGHSRDRVSLGIYGDMGAARDAIARADSGSAARFFYCAKASKEDRDAGLEGFKKSAAGMVSNTSGQHMTRRDEGYQVSPRANNHPTVKPTDLMRYLCRLVTPAGGLVLDPFMGSGSTGKAAVLEGFQFVGIDEDPVYAAIAEARIRVVQPGLPLEGIA
ncbi:TPA: site-specific DNA-methyltransferase [Stenotrophomonas maltophilia]|uniref:DNA-methyltransferase n=2 Tax=Stenotrophomonas TaxID=40323 RepID=UPI001954C10B|nr:site-specific DNA-methyltransferase [Stenotrophomonas maltophilia]